MKTTAKKELHTECILGPNHISYTNQIIHPRFGLLDFHNENSL